MEKLAVLEALEKGAVTAAPGVRREALRELREYRAGTRREALALARGWEPWTAPGDIAFGLVEPPGHHWGPVLAGMIAGIVGTLAVLVGVLLTGVPRPLIAIVGVVAGTVAAFIGGLRAIYQFAERGSRFHTAAPEQTGRASDGGDRYRVYRGTFPVAAWKRYQRDCGLFDRVYVASQDTRAFEWRQAWVADPFLVGEIGRKLYLGAHWDLVAELKLAEVSGRCNVEPSI